MKRKKMNIELCNGEPTIGNLCPQKQICKFFLEYEAFNPRSSALTPSYISAFYCSSKDWHKFEEIQPFDTDPLLVLSNKMVVRFYKTHTNPEFDIYKVILPQGVGKLAFDGNLFYSVNQITLDILEPLSEVSILNKKVINV